MHFAQRDIVLWNLSAECPFKHRPSTTFRAAVVVVVGSEWRLYGSAVCSCMQMSSSSYRDWVVVVGSEWGIEVCDQKGVVYRGHACRTVAVLCQRQGALYNENQQHKDSVRKINYPHVELHGRGKVGDGFCLKDRFAVDSQCTKGLLTKAVTQKTWVFTHAACNAPLQKSHRKPMPLADQSAVSVIYTTIDCKSHTTTNCKSRTTTN